MTFETERHAATEQEAISLAARALSSEIAAYGKMGPVLFLFSGGSALSVLREVDPTVFGPIVTVSTLDERATNKEDDNNYLQFTGVEHPTKVFQALTHTDTRFISSVPGIGELLSDFADRMNNSVSGWLADNPNGHVVALQGVGADGHTAGIMPDPDNPDSFEQRFHAPGRFIVGYKTDYGSHPQRITVTPDFLENRVDSSVVFTGGPEKHEILRKALTPGPLAEIPARIIGSMEGKVRLFTW
jgi:6-phosphogluconolactonase/glucosamine-6-phosphate isomerase/deaminase